MAEPALPPDMREGPSKGGGLDAPAFAPPAAPTAGFGSEAPGAGGKEGPLPEPAAPLQAPEISGPAPSTPARAAPLSAAPPSPMGLRGVTAGEAAAAPASPRRSAAGRLPPIVYGGLAALMAATALFLLLLPRLVGWGWGCVAAVVEELRLQRCGGGCQRLPLHFANPTTPPPRALLKPAPQKSAIAEQVAMGMFRKSASHPMDAQLTQLLQAST